MLLPFNGGEFIYVRPSKTLFQPSHLPLTISQLQESYTRPKYLAGCIFAFLFIIVGNTAPNCLVFAEYIVTAFNPDSTDSTNPRKLDDRLLKFVALVCITFICTLHIFSRKVGIATNNGWHLFHVLLSDGLIVLSSCAVQSHFPAVCLHCWPGGTGRCQSGWEEGGRTIRKRKFQRLIPSTTEHDPIQLRKIIIVSFVCLSRMVCVNSNF